MHNYICNVLGTIRVYLLTNKRIFICNMHSNYNIETLRSKKLVLIRDGCEGKDCNILHTYTLNTVECLKYCGIVFHIVENPHSY